MLVELYAHVPFVFGRDIGLHLIAKGGTCRLTLERNDFSVVPMEFEKWRE